VIFFYSKQKRGAFFCFFETKKSPTFSRFLGFKFYTQSNDSKDEFPVAKLVQKKKRTPSIRQALQITAEQDQILVGGLLGDMHVEFRGLNSRFKFRHGINQQEYVMWKYEKLKNLIPKPPQINLEKNRGKDKEGQTYQVVWCNSYTNSAFNSYRDIWYNVDGVKEMPKDIEKYLTPLSLFVMFYDDGSAVRTSKGFRLALNSFSKEDLELFCKALYNKFGIKAELRGKYKDSKGKDRWILYLKAAEGTKFYNLISPIIKDANLKTMLYKTRRHQTDSTNDEDDN